MLVKCLKASGGNAGTASICARIMCKACSVSAATQQALAKEKVGSLCLVPSKHTVHTDMTQAQTHGRGINTATKSDQLRQASARIVALP